MVLAWEGGLSISHSSVTMPPYGDVVSCQPLAGLWLVVENTFPSTPITEFGCKVLPQEIEDVARATALYKSMPLPSSCCSAWRKYEFVHSPALSVITTVPAEPVKPDIHSLDFQHGATHSLRCGSALGIMKASMFFFNNVLHIYTLIDCLSHIFINVLQA